MATWRRCQVGAKVLVAVMPAAKLKGQLRLKSESLLDVMFFFKTVYSCDARTPRRCRIMTRKFHGNDSVLMSLTDENYDIIDIDHCRKSSSPAAPILDTSRIPTPDITAVPMPGCGLAACPGGLSLRPLKPQGLTVRVAYRRVAQLHSTAHTRLSGGARVWQIRRPNRRRIRRFGGISD